MSDVRRVSSAAPPARTCTDKESSPRGPSALLYSVPGTDVPEQKQRGLQGNPPWPSVQVTEPGCEGLMLEGEGGRAERGWSGVLVVIWGPCSVPDQC